MHRIALAVPIVALVAAGPLASLAAVSSPPLRGTITSVNGNMLTIQDAVGGAAKVHLADNTTVVSVAKASVSDIKPGSYIGTAATPKTDGTLQAIEIHIFPPSMRGAGEGTRDWNLAPKSSMTNGTVKKNPAKVADNKVNKVDGNTITVDYNGGSKAVEITPSTKVVSLVPGNRS